MAWLGRVVGMDWTQVAGVLGGIAGVAGSVVSVLAARDARGTRRLAEADARRSTEGAVIELSVRPNLRKSASLVVSNVGADAACDVYITISGRGGANTQRVADRVEPGHGNGVVVDFMFDVIVASRGLESENYVDTTVSFKTPAGIPMQKTQQRVMVYVHQRDRGI